MATEVKWDYDKAETISSTIATKADAIKTESVAYPAGVYLVGASNAHGFYASMCTLTNNYKEALKAEVENIKACNTTLKETDESLAGH